ncbi:DUF2513 domain-containing protein [Hymenobacter profundi]|uniref:DUF2513 domain-containing protein n=1 Tax=Hymenobacter profundi TaxID=1982110 RepID=A0ABS6X4F0_9BACT|nr:DUF2513 domain-containing protein [Hymenobacter profundi]MBW3130722.1 DUF2513 domain-containing protein [Hymenobacter profundi]
MRRDIELVKSILEYFEAKTDFHHEEHIVIDGYSSNLIKYHLQIMYEAGFINAEPIQSQKGRLYSLLPFRLTWQGHEFLDTIRSKKTWSRIKSIVQSKGLDLSFEVIKKLADKLTEDDLTKGLFS